jgi:hypothetical protein
MARMGDFYFHKTATSTSTPANFLLKTPPKRLFYLVQDIEQTCLQAILVMHSSKVTRQLRIQWF